MLLKHFYLLDLVSHIVNIVCHFWGHNKMCSIINHSNAAMIMFQPRDSQNNDIIQVHLCRGNIAIIKWYHGYGSSDDELIVLSWRLFLQYLVPLIFLAVIVLSHQQLPLATCFHSNRICHTYTVIFCFNLQCYELEI